MKQKIKNEVSEVVTDSVVAEIKNTLIHVHVGDIVVLKKGTRFFKEDEQYLVVQINPTWRYIRGTHTGKTEVIHKYILTGNGNIHKVDLDEIDYVVRNIENKKGKK